MNEFYLLKKKLKMQSKSELIKLIATLSNGMEFYKQKYEELIKREESISEEKQSNPVDSAGC